MGGRGASVSITTRKVENDEDKIIEDKIKSMRMEYIDRPKSKFFEPMTYNQEKYINSLIERKKNSEEVANDFEYFNYIDKNRLSKQDASEMINELLVLKDKNISPKEVENKRIQKQINYIFEHKKSKKWASKMEQVSKALNIHYFNKQTKFTDDQLQAIKKIIF